MILAKRRFKRGAMYDYHLCTVQKPDEQINIDAA